MAWLKESQQKGDVNVQINDLLNQMKPNQAKLNI